MIPIIIFQVYYSTMNMSACIISWTRRRVLDALSSLSPLTLTPLPHQRLSYALCVRHFAFSTNANNYLDDFKTETEVGPSGIWNLDQRILHISTITITATTPIYHLDLSITLSSNPRSPARVSCDIIVNLDQTRKLRNQKSHFKITDARKEKLPRYLGKQIIISIYSFHLCNNVNFTY